MITGDHSRRNHSRRSRARDTRAARKPTLDLPLKLILTPAGIGFFVRNEKKLNRFPLPGDQSEYGLYLNHFSPASLQRMLLLDFIARIEVSAADYVPLQRDLVDLGKLIVYGMIYHQFDAAVHEKIFESDLIVRWNRRHLHKPIDRDTKVNETYVRMLLEKRPDLAKQFEADVIEPVRSAIIADGELGDREKEIQLFIAEKFVSNLQPFHWYLLTEFRGAEEYGQLIETIRAVLGSIRHRTAIAEYVALATQEMLTTAVNVNLQSLARERQGAAWDPARVLHDRSVRESLVAGLSARKQLVTVSWQISAREAGASAGLNNLGVSVESRDPERVIFWSPAGTRDRPEPRRTLQSFYENIPEEVTDTELALYYYSYLLESCSAHDIDLDSSVHEGANGGISVLSLVLQF